MIYRILLFFFACVTAFGQFSGPVSPTANVQSVELLGQVLSRVPATNVVYVVRGRTSVGDWGSPRIVRWDPASAIATNIGTIRGTTNGIGRWVVAWEDGDVRVFGAKGDGLTDDTASVQAAINYASTTGKPLYFPTGTYVASGLVASSGSDAQLIITGDKPFGSKQVSESRSVIKLKNSAGVTASLLTAASGSPITLRNIAFDGNRANNGSTTNALIRLEGTGYDETLFENVAVFHAPKDALYITRDESRLVQYYALYCGGNGITYYNTTDHQIDYALLGYNDGDGLYAYQLYASRFKEIDSYQNKGHGIYVEDSRDARWQLIQPQQNWKSGARMSCWNMTIEGFVPLWNNSDDNYHGPSPYPAGTYSEVEWFGSSQNLTVIGGIFGDSVVRPKLPNYLFDDQRSLSYAQAGLGITLIGINARKDYGFVTGRWPSHVDRNAIITAYDIADGERYQSIFGLQKTVAGGYPVTVQKSEHLLILSGVGRHVVLPATNAVPDGWRVTIVDASGTAETNNIAVSSAAGFVFGVSTNRLYDNSGIWTFIKSGVNYGMESFSSPEQLLVGDMSYRWQTRNGPRLTITADQSRDSVGIPLVLNGYRTSGTDYNRLMFHGFGGTVASPAGLASNSTPGQIVWKARLSDGTDSGYLARVLAVGDDTPTPTNAPFSILFQTTASGNEGAKYTRMGNNGSWSIRDDGGANSAGAGAILELVSTNKGFVPPRLTTAQRTAFVPTRDGIHVFDLTEVRPYYSSNGTWVALGGGGGTSFTTGVGVTNIAGVLSGNYSPGANVTFTTNASGNVSIAASGGGGATNGTAVSVDGALATAVNVADSSEINPTLSGTNLTLALISSSIGTNRLTASAYDGITWHFLTNALLASNNVTITRDGSTRRIMLEASGGGSITANGTNITAITNSADIMLEVTGSTVSAVLAEDISTTTIRANELVLTNVLTVPVGGTGRSNITANAYLAGNGTNAVSIVGPTAKALAGWNDSGTAAAVTTGVGVTNLGGVLSGNYSPGSNVTFATNANGNVTISATSGGGSTNGTPVSVDGASVTAANFDDGGDINFTATGTNVTGVVKADAVALGTDTTGNYVATVAGTANEVSVSGSGSESAAVTLSFPATIDLGGKTSFEIPNAAAPTVDVFGEIAGDNDAWAASRGAVVFYDGTAATRLVGVLATDTPSNGQVPKWNTGGTITWEDVSGSAVSVDGALAAAVNFADGAEITFTLTTTNATAAIANDAVDYAQMQNVSAASRVLGRGSASGSGDAQELTVVRGLAIQGTEIALTNNFTSGHFAGGFLPLYAGVSNFLYGALHYRSGSDIRSPMWETNTAFEAVGQRANNGIWSVVQYATNDFSVIETMLEVDPSAKSGGTNTVTIPNGGFNNLFSVAPNALFAGDVEFQGNISLGAAALATTAAAGTSNTLAATTAYADRAVQMAGTNTLQVASVTIFDPDGVQAVSDAVPLLAIESTWAPNGITIRDIYLKTDSSSTYSINLEEWTSPTDGSPSTIETVATSSTTEAEDDGTLSDSSIAAGSIVFVDLPSTAANWIQVTVTYYIK